MPPSNPLRRPRQAGFTLIESTVVIAVMGVLAATALPKLAELRTAAHVASLKTVRGALQSTAALVHAHALLRPSAATISSDGVTVRLASGYPSAAQYGNAAAAAGLGAADYVIRYGPAAPTATQPALPANAFAAIPAGVADTAAAPGCHVLYTGASGAGATITPPSVTVVSNGC